MPFRTQENRYTLQVQGRGTIHISRQFHMNSAFHRPVGYDKK